MTRRTDSEAFFRRGASMSQQLSDLDPLFREISGCDPETAESIGFFMELGKHKLIDLEDPNIKLMMGLLRVRLKVSFACSDTTNEITKMGLRMPRSEPIYYDE